MFLILPEGFAFLTPRIQYKLHIFVSFGMITCL